MRRQHTIRLKSIAATHQTILSPGVLQFSRERPMNKALNVLWFNVICLWNKLFLSYFINETFRCSQIRMQPSYYITLELIFHCCSSESLACIELKTLQFAIFKLPTVLFIVHCKKSCRFHRLSLGGSVSLCKLKKNQPQSMCLKYVHKCISSMIEAYRLKEVPFIQ